MQDRMQSFTRHELTQIHDASMDILAHAGLNFNDDATVDLFKKMGFRTDGRRVFIHENDVYSALQTVPPRFTIHARNPEKSPKIEAMAAVLMVV